MKRLSISIYEEDYKLIQDFCKDNCLNMSAMTIKFWKDYIKQAKVFKGKLSGR
jgi:hypothetical protein